MTDALLALLAKRPLETITAGMVADRAGIGYATFFRHHADVPALLAETVAALADEMAARMIPPLVAGDTAAAAASLVHAVDERRGAFRALFTGAGDALRGTLARRVASDVAALPDLSPAWLPTRLAIRVAVASTIELLDWWLREAPDRSVDDIAALLDRLVLATITIAPHGG